MQILLSHKKSSFHVSAVFSFQEKYFQRLRFLPEEFFISSNLVTAI